MILLDRVTKVYGKGSKPALDRVNLHVEPNEFVIIVGILSYYRTGQCSKMWLLR